MFPKQSYNCISQRSAPDFSIVIDQLTDDRAWIGIGTTMRLALAAGLHTQSQSLTADPTRKQALVQTWWSLQNLEILLSSLIGRPSMIRKDQVTTPLPSDMIDHEARRGPNQTPSLPYLEGQVSLTLITQEVLSKLYTERRAIRLWPQIHAIMSSLLAKLDEWALEVQSQVYEAIPANQIHDVESAMLRKQYCRVKILITRPSLRRIERCSETGSEDFTVFDQEVAEECIRTANEAVSLLPDEVDLKALYERGPWWTATHNGTPRCPCRSKSTQS
jgi:hypothetical protein